MQRHWCALIGTCTANTHVGIYLFYLFNVFDLENVCLASMEMVTELDLAVRGIVLGVFDQTKSASSFFEALQKHGLYPK